MPCSVGSTGSSDSPTPPPKIEPCAILASGMLHSLTALIAVSVTTAWAEGPDKIVEFGKAQSAETRKPEQPANVLFRLPKKAPLWRTGGAQPTACENAAGKKGYNPRPIEQPVACHRTPEGPHSDSCEVLSGPLAPRRTTRFRANAECVEYMDSQLSGKDLRAYRLDGARLEGANLSGALLQAATLERAELSAANFSTADFTPTDDRALGLPSTESSPTGNATGRMRPASLDGSDATRANFTSAKLRGAWLSLANFSCASFEGADLSGAVAIGSIFQGAFLVKANLRDLRLGNSTFVGANLSGADLTGLTAFPAGWTKDLAKVFRGAIIDSKTLLPWSHEQAVAAGMIDAKDVKPLPGLPGTSVPTPENCEVKIR